MTDQTVLVADADRESRTSMSKALTEAGYRVMEAGDGPYALRQAFNQPPVAAILDLNIPLLNGLELVKVLRAASDMAIVVITESPSPHLAVRVLDTGADDFIAKPAHLAEIVARIRSSLRRVERQAASMPVQTGGRDVVRTGPLEIDLDAHVVMRQGDEIQMTRTEYLLLEALSRRVGQVAPHRYLLTEVWGTEYLDDTHYLRGYMASLRNKLEDDPSKPRLLLTEWGVGYRMASLPVELDTPRTLGLFDSLESIESLDAAGPYQGGSRRSVAV